MTRTELYGLVWAEPVTKIAARFGMSDRGLAKLCERHHIPLPPRGYWARIAADRYPPQSPLPRPESNPVIRIRSLEASAESLRQSNADLGEIIDVQPKVKRLNESPPPEKQRTVKQRKAVTARAKPEACRNSEAVNSETVEKYAALEAECDKLISAGRDYQCFLSAQLLLKAIVSEAPKLEQKEAQTLLAWSVVVAGALDRRNPTRRMIGAILEDAD